MKLTPNFKASELFVSESYPHLVDDWAKIPLAHQNNVRAIVNRLQVIRDILGRPITITSGYRGPALNKEVKGDPNSYHLTGSAVDFVVSGMSAKAVQSRLDAWWGGGLGYGKGFTHIDLGPKRRFNY